MSHFADFKTEMKDLESLIRALVRKGFKREQIEVYGTAVKLENSYDHNVKKANVVIRAKNNGINADIGWEFDKKEGVYVSHIDEYEWGGKPHYNKDWQQSLVQYYNLECSKMLCESRGVECEEGKDSNGDPVLTARFREVNNEDKVIADL